MCLYLLVLDASGGNRSTQEILFGSRVAGGRQAGFLGAFDLSYATVVNDELHNSEAKALNFLPNKGNPVRRGAVGGTASNGAIPADGTIQTRRTQ